jgi:signal transduction histidine kinase/PAS domain-containing protein
MSLLPNYHFTPYILPLIAAALFSAWVVGYSWSRRSSPVAMALILMGAGILIWSVGYALEICAAAPETKFLWGKIEYIGIALVPYAWVIFSYYHSHRGERLNSRALLLLAVVPLVTVLLALTTELHGLLWSSYTVQQHGSLSMLTPVHGLWFWVHTTYSYLLVLASTVLIVRLMVQSKGLFRRQAVAMSIAVITPWAGNIVYLTGSGVLSYLDLTPFAFALSLLAMAWAIYGGQLVSISPVSRGLIVDTLEGGIIVLNLDNHILDINRAAGRFIGVPAAQAVGKAAGEIFAPWPELVKRFREVMDHHEVIAIGTGETQRRFELIVSPLADQEDRVIGRLIFLHPLGKQIHSEPKPMETPAEPILVDDPRDQPVVSAGTAPQKYFAKSWSQRLYNRVADFFQVPLWMDIAIPPGVNPDFHRFLERTFTLIMRFCVPAALATTLVAKADFGTFLAGYFINLSIEVCLLPIALARKLPLNLRILGFLCGFYAFGIIELFSFGYSIECFTLFMIFIVSAGFLAGARGGWIAWSLSAVTLGFFGWLFAQRLFIPLAMDQSPRYYLNQEWPIPILITFLAGAAGLSILYTVVWNYLNRTWRRERQSANLVQQERDLLEVRVNERTQALEEAKEKAEAANRAKSTFLANMTHELRTPLNAILGFAQLLEHDSDTSPTKKESLEIIIHSGEHLLTLINDILDMSKLEAGRFTLDVDDFDLPRLLQDLRGMFQLRALEKGIDLLFVSAPGLPRMVGGDCNKLGQVLINLIGNALKFTATGNVTLNVAYTDPQAGGAEGAALLHFAVADTGEGIAAEEIEMLFQPFVQTSSGQNAQGGTGLGLAISRQFVHLMGGEIRVVSQPGQGSVFSFDLPLTLAASGHTPAESSAAEGLEGAVQPANATAGLTTPGVITESARMTWAAEALWNLPAAWVTYLYQVCTEVDLDKTRAAITQMATRDPALAEYLTELVSGFRLDEILELYEVERRSA